MFGSYGTGHSASYTDFLKRILEVPILRITCYVAQYKFLTPWSGVTFFAE